MSPKKVEGPPDYNDSGATDPADFIAKYGGGRLHTSYLHEFRTFALNDDGWLSHLGLDIPDLSDYGIAVGSDTPYVRRPRAITRTLTEDSSDRSWRPAYVEIGIVGDDNSWIPLPTAVPLNDHGGFRIRYGRLDQWCPYDNEHISTSLLEAYAEETYATLLYRTLAGAEGNKLRLRLTGMIECDEGLVEEAARQSTSNWVLTSTHVEPARKRYKKHTVVDGSGTERDDSTDIAAAASQVRDASEDAMGHGSVILRTITTEWEPGTAIEGTSGRAISFVIDGGADTYYPIVQSLTFNFVEGAMKTEIVLDSPLVRVML